MVASGLRPTWHWLLISLYILSARAFLTQTSRPMALRMVSLFASSVGGGDTNQDGQEFLDYDIKYGFTIKKKGKQSMRDNREQLPFKIFIDKEFLLGNEPRALGNFNLEASTACGDLLDLPPHGTFTVLRVVHIYRWNSSGGRHVVVGKRLEVEPVSLKSLDGILQ